MNYLAAEINKFSWVMILGVGSIPYKVSTLNRPRRSSEGWLDKDKGQALAYVRIDLVIRAQELLRIPC